MISVSKYEKPGYEWELNNYDEVFYRDSKKNWATLGGSYVGSAEDQLLTDLLIASVSRRRLKKQRRMPILQSIIKNMLDNRAIELNGIHYLPKEKLQEIERAIENDCPDFWRINYGKKSNKTRKGDIKQALKWVRQ